jgi:high-affinity iron transporter
MPPLDAFLVVLRESLEAFLIIGILTGIVVKLGHPQARIPIYLGALAGVALSIVLGLVIHATAQDLFERHEEAFEGVAALVAVGILTYMIVWMYRHTITLVAALRDRAKAALASGKHAVLFGLAFVAVAREGIETVLFLATQVGSITAGGLVGATLAGVATSALLAALLFTGVIRRARGKGNAGAEAGVTPTTALRA